MYSGVLEDTLGLQVPALGLKYANKTSTALVAASPNSEGALKSYRASGHALK